MFGAMIGAVYVPLVDLVLEYLFLSEGEQVRLKAWAFYVRGLPSFIFSGGMAGSVWWWVEKRCADD
jgi:hypothetical protein